MAIGVITRFLDFLAKMGLTMRDDPPKKIDLSTRQWGPAAGGFALSIQEVPNEDPDAVSAVSVVLRNVGADVRPLVVPGWLFFYRFDVTTADGTAVPISSFGRELLKPERRTERIELSLEPGELTETQIPIGSIFSMKRSSGWRVNAFCEPAEGLTVRSNEIVLT